MVLYEIYIKYLSAEILLTLSVVKVASADAQPHRSIIHANPRETKSGRGGGGGGGGGLFFLEGRKMLHSAAFWI